MRVEELDSRHVDTRKKVRHLLVVEIDVVSVLSCLTHQASHLTLPVVVTLEIGTPEEVYAYAYGEGTFRHGNLTHFIDVAAAEDLRACW